jgi:hypothetical protein
MPITATWFDEEHTIILQSYMGDWTWDDWNVCNDELQAMLDSVDHTVHTIIDVSQSGQLPPGGYASRRSDLPQTPPVTHPHSGYLVFVGTTFAHEALTDVITTFFTRVGRRFLFTDSFEDVDALLAEVGVGEI